MRLQSYLFSLLFITGLSRAHADGDSAASADAPARLSEGDELLRAYAWAVGGTVLPLTAAYYLGASENTGTLNEFALTTLAITGLIVGPSMGQFYSGSYSQGVAGGGIRVAGGIMTIAGAVSLLSDFGCGFNEDGEEKCSDHHGERLAYAGLAVYAGGALYSFIDTRFAVHRGMERKRKNRIGWSPTVLPGSDGRLMPGALAWMSF